MDLATVAKLLTTTRTVRRRLDLSRPVTRDVIQECIEIAVQAPTAGNSQRWHFVVVTDPAKRAAIADVYRRARARYHAKPPAFLPGSLPPTSSAPRTACGDPATISPNTCRMSRC